MQPVEPTVPAVSVILPAHDETDYIGHCLSALLASQGDAPLEVLVIANACRDDTAAKARGFADLAQARGWSLQVIETETGGKLNALNLGDRAARGDIRIYLDADVIVSPPLLEKMIEALSRGPALYAGAEPRVAPARSAVTRAYARFWQTLPFVTQGVPGFGIFAMTRRGRARWRDWPDIISDDTFARLNFAPSERHRVAARYTWPMVEGFANLVRVRRRQNDGVTEVAKVFPHLMAHEDSHPPGLGGTLARALRDPIGFAVYVAVAIAVKTPPMRGTARWARGR
ncbi:MAG: glycosyltransferase family 2 protein [Rhodobacteraceae bacterium]|nr:glycosyltransferase family 2 protein [Paracoccaceae bacterium]